MEQAHAVALLNSLVSKSLQGLDRFQTEGLRVQVTEVFRGLFGDKSEFTRTIIALGSNDASYIKANLPYLLNSAIEHLSSGVIGGVSVEQRARIDVVSDFLEQAHKLLESKSVHPAAPAVLIGASLEEFLRTWVESLELTINGKNPSLESYGHSLLAADLLSKQDIKDITSWAGLRNHAAHGEWSEVEDRNRISIMLEGVNLFMRKYAK